MRTEVGEGLVQVDGRLLFGFGLRLGDDILRLDRRRHVGLLHRRDDHHRGRGGATG